VQLFDKLKFEWLRHTGMTGRGGRGIAFAACSFRFGKIRPDCSKQCMCKIDNTGQIHLVNLRKRAGGNLSALTKQREIGILNLGMYIPLPVSLTDKERKRFFRYDAVNQENMVKEKDQVRREPI